MGIKSPFWGLRTIQSLKLVLYDKKDHVKKEISIASKIKILIKFRSFKPKYLKIWNWSSTLILLIWRCQRQSEIKIKFINIIFFNKNLDFLNINKIEIENMKKTKCKISGFGKLIPSRNKLNIRSKFIYK